MSDEHAGAPSATGVVIRDDSNDDPNSGLTVYVGLVGCVLLFLIIVALQVIFNHMARDEFEAKTLNVVPPTLELVQSEQRAILNGYGWVDETNDVVRIPVDRAMDLVVKELNP